MLLRWFNRLTAILLTGLLLFALLLPQAAIAQTWDEQIHSTPYHGAPVPDWRRISLSDLPALQAGGTLQIPDRLADQLGYNPSRIWQAGAAIGDVFMLADVQDAFRLETFSLSQVAQIAGLNLDRISLSNFPLIQRQTIADLVRAVPGLGNLRLSQVPLFQDLIDQTLVNSAVGQLNLNDWGGQSLASIATDETLGQLSLGNTPHLLEQYSLADIPNLDQVRLENFQGWQATFISEVPGLDRVPMSEFPNTPAGEFLGFVAIDDVTYGNKEHRVKATTHSITGSNRVGFHYQCAQERGCAYLELNSPVSLGEVGDPTGLHGAQWIQGGRSQGGQMVPGGEGILGAINGGLEPTGRLPFGAVFKVVLTGTDEATGTGQFGLFFRVCHRGVVDLGCTPYFIGPVPWFSVHEKGLVFVGETPGEPPADAPQPPPLPPDVQQQIDDLIRANDPNGNSTPVQLDRDCLARLMAAVPAAQQTNAARNLPIILAEAKRDGITDPAQLAYILATVQHESLFAPIREFNSYCGQYGPGCYYGRGFVQLTLESNYRDWSNRLGIDLVHNPDRVYDPQIAAQILVQGMRDGTFTRRRLGQFIHGSQIDFLNARSIVNGDKNYVDRRTGQTHGAIIASYAQRYLEALSGCSPTSPPSGSGGSQGAGVATGHFVHPVPGHTAISGRFHDYRHASDHVRAHYHRANASK
ncbi:hypothetical protein H6F67_24475 [Microcoleus sp. FACHB-1515]|uniref:hypothetical protein n=1 Tax=Cyanophyceae TaxID=3028117 RepID=UPI00168296BA|nr:hypothetical protein [Microcoleus sp. FACHB-1515]MBD2093007.1 hypothetical protein [Microcoleus sp. FACHB-1515]